MATIRCFYAAYTRAEYPCKFGVCDANLWPLGRSQGRSLSLAENISWCFGLKDKDLYVKLKHDQLY